MKKADMKYLVDSLLFISMVGIILIGLLLAFFLAEGPVQDESRKVFLGLHRHQWSAVHLYLSLAFSGLIIIHLVLAWDWIKARARSIFKGGWRAALAGTAAAGLLILGIFWAALPKNAPEFSGFGVRSGELHERLAQDREGRGALASAVEPRPAETTARRQVAPARGNRAGTTAEHREATEDHPVRGRLDETSSGILVTGRMTLQDLERQTGVAADRIISGLGLPARTSRREALGRLRRTHGFTMLELREVLEKLMK